MNLGALDGLFHPDDKSGGGQQLDFHTTERVADVDPDRCIKRLTRIVGQNERNAGLVVRTGKPHHRYAIPRS